ncbi:MAG TPA: MFS transporter [Candidatus Limnocylindrales bacterium]|nr:MFS transporter [Candidatus Limnocylindrales bacterium]
MPNPVTSWRSLLLVFGVTAMVEGIGVSQVFALLPSLLSTMGVPDGERLSFIGLFSSLLFVLGMPLVPLWGVWADKYSRRAVIARSAAVEVVVFGGLALAREPWQVALCMLLIGFQLGNTGVMLAGIRDVTPRQRLGLVIALFGASGAVGFALGPVLAGILIDGAGWSISMVFGLSAAMSLGTALLVMLGTREVRPEVVPRGRVISLAFGAVRGVIADPAVRRIFLTYFAAFLANQMSRPFLPVLVETIVGRGPGLASAIGLVSGTAALAGALLSPLGGALGDRIGFRRVLLAALGVAAVAIALLPAAAAIGGLATLALVAVVVALAIAAVGAMVFGLLATEVPPERRSATLNLVYLPLYAAGIIGPAIGGLVVQAGLPGPFLVGGAALAVATVVLALQGRRPQGQPPEAQPPETPPPRATAPSPGSP